MATPKKTTSKTADSLTSAVKKSTAATKKAATKTKAVAGKATTKAKAAPKKVVAKTKTVASKAKKAPVKVVAKAKTAAPRVMDSAPQTTKGGTGGILGWLIAILLGGALLGTYLADSYWMGQFDAEESMVVIDDTTWMPVGGTPVTVVVLNDEKCGAACSTQQGLDSLRASVNPALKIETIDVSSAEGQKLIEDFDLVSVPQYFFGEDIEDFEVPNPQDPEADDVRFIDNLPAGLLTEKDDLYYIDGARVGFKPGKFITPPAFADLASEPAKGNGPVKVVEFTNYQCSFCKRFHDQNKSLIDQLVADGIIIYVVKDFPMFNRNDRFAHQAANCALKQGGQDTYWKMNASILAAQSTWSNDPDAEAYFVALATEQGVDIADCMNDADVRAEIDADMAEGSKYGVTGTPSVFVGTQILPGAVGPAVLKAAVEAELGK